MRPFIILTACSFLAMASSASASTYGRKPLVKHVTRSPAGTTPMLNQADQRPGGSTISGDFGVGLMLGEPTGVSVKKWLSRTTAFDLSLSYSFFSFFQITGDYLWHLTKAMMQITSGKLSEEFVPYVGAGGVLFF